MFETIGVDFSRHCAGEEEERIRHFGDHVGF